MSGGESSEEERDSIKESELEAKVPSDEQAASVSPSPSLSPDGSASPSPSSQFNQVSVKQVLMTRLDPASWTNLCLFVNVSETLQFLFFLRYAL